MAGDIIRPVDVARDEAGRLILEDSDDTRVLEGLSEESLATVRVRRIGNAMCVGNSKQPLHIGMYRMESPNDPAYAAMVAEAGPNEIQHHPV